MSNLPLTNYDQQASYFSQLPDYALDCGTDFLAVKDVPALLQNVQPLKKILDIGCGTGLATRFLKKHFPTCEIIGADINASMIDEARKADTEGNYIHLKTNGGAIDYHLATDFDAITASFMLHENKTVAELQAFFEGISSHLRAGGLFLAWDPSQNLFMGKWATLSVLTPYHNIEDGNLYEVKLSPSNAKVTGTFWTPKTIARLAEMSGFKHLQTFFPTAENTNFPWADEVHTPPYFVFMAKKT